jgi:uncharacterized protein YjbI with pentapeptide repeats
MADQHALSLIQEDRPLDFNRLIEPLNGKVDLTDAQFRGYDLRKFNLKNANLANAYLRNADLRGLDLTGANLAGVSIKDAKISGTYFPSNIPADEIRLSHEFGNRMRTQ